MRRFSLALAVAFLAGAPAAPADGGFVSEKPGRFLKIDRVERGTGGETVVSGVVSGYPDGVVVVGTVQFGGAQGPFARAGVEQGKFSIRFEAPKGRVIAGTYAFQAETTARDQAADVVGAIPGGFPPDVASVQVLVGTSEEAGRDLGLVRDKIGLTINGMRTLFRQLVERGSFVFARMNAEKKNAGGTLGDAARDKIHEDWNRYSETYWEDALRTIDLDWREYRAAVFLSPLPEAEADVEQAFVFLRRFYGAYWGEIGKWLERPVPQRVEGSPFTRAQLQGQLQAVAHRVYEKAGIVRLDWDIVDLAAEEKGDTEGDTYVSRTTKFRVTRPSGWTFDTTGTSPTARLRLVPPVAPGAEGKPTVIVVVEVKDYPEAESFADLARMTEMFNHERWPGFKKLTSRDLKVKDATMADGVRPGFEIVLKTEDKKRTFKLADYELFCRWHKRTYGVLCIAPPDVWGEYAEAFAAIQESFAILDAPEEGKK